MSHEYKTLYSIQLTAFPIPINYTSQTPPFSITILSRYLSADLLGGTLLINHINMQSPSLNEFNATLAITNTPPTQPARMGSNDLMQPMRTTIEIEAKLSNAKRPLNDPLQTQPKSARAMNHRQLANILIRSAVQENPPLILNIERYRALIKQSGKYTGQNDGLNAALHFMKDTLDICPTDSKAAILRWGQPAQPVVSKIFSAYIAAHFPDVKVNGKTLGTVFRHLAKVIWPRFSAGENKTKAKWRCLYGIRLRAIKEEESISNVDTTALQITNRTFAQPEHITNLFQTPTGGTQSNQPLYRIRSTPAMRQASEGPAGTCVPAYDILHNDGLYIVRVFLPLMKDRTAQNLQITVQPNRRKCLIKGSYIPSTLIGNESAKLLRLKQPLLPIVYSEHRTTGQFELDIALPDDIRDDKQGVNVIHDCWGILISFPRRKIAHDAQINLVI